VVAIERLLEAASAEPPCGPNLEYDAEFLDLLRLARGKPAQQMGDAIQEAEPPDWRQVVEKAEVLLGTSKDLRIAIQLVRGLLETQGFQGLATGLELAAKLLELYWDGLHPKLDPDDDNDPTMRLNILAELIDPAGVLARVRSTPLVSVRGLGTYSLRDLAIAAGELQPAEGEEPVTTPSIEAAFTAVDVGELQATFDAVVKARESTAAIETVLADKAGGGPEVHKLRTVLDQAKKTLDAKLEQRGVRGSEAPVEETAGTNGNGRSLSLSGEIASREQVVTAIDAIIRYYDRFEPSSPIPLMLGRCRRLVFKSFLDILRDVAPDAVGQAEALRGRDSEEGRN
jgi:type VI secretion system protein ImpA